MINFDMHIKSRKGIRNRISPVLSDLFNKSIKN